MFEAQAAYYLNKYLGQYVDGVDPKSLRISVWQGDVVLKDLRVRPEALAELNLPITVRAGLLGTLRLKVPWAKLGKEPVVVEIDKLYVLATPLQEHRDFDSDEALDEFVKHVAELEQKHKRKRVESAELEWMQRLGAGDGKAAKQTTEQGEGGVLQYYIETILGNLQLRITNVHIRYEDAQTTEGEKFAVGFTLGELSAITVDQQGNKAFVTAKQMKEIRKAVNLRRLALYFDVDGSFWEPSKTWGKLSVTEWDSFFLPSIHKNLDNMASSSMYILRPVDGSLRYLRRRRVVGQQLPENQAKQEINVQLQEVSAHISRRQYEHMQNFLTVFNLYQLSTPHRHLRPPTRPVNFRSARLWWNYAFKAVKQTVLGRTVSFYHLYEIGRIRKMYIPLYIKCLQQDNVGGDATIAKFDEHMEENTILVFRRLAHVKVEQAKRKALAKAAAERAEKKQVGWIEWMWGTTGESTESQSQNIPTELEKEDSEMEKAGLSAEEWDKFNELLAVQVQEEDEDVNTPYTLLMQFTANVETLAVSLSDLYGNRILYGALMNSVITHKAYPQTVSLEYTVVAGTLSAPEGVLMSTGITPDSSEKIPCDSPPAVTISYTHLPQDKPIKASLQIQSACAYITYHASALNSVMAFFQSVEQADFSVLEAQAAAGLKKAAKKAEEQFLEMLDEQQDLFEVNLDMDAPKLAIPIQREEFGRAGVTLVLDLGHLGVVTDAEAARKLPQKELGKYECMQVQIRDVGLYAVDGEFGWPKRPTLTLEKQETQMALDEYLAERALVIPILEKCGLKSDIQLTRGYQPGLTPVRLTFDVPAIRFHFSPGRYGRAMKILDSLYATPTPVHQPDQTCLDRSAFHLPVELLSWEGLGNLTPKWKPHFAVIKKGYLYIYTNPGCSEVAKWVRLSDDLLVTGLTASNALGKKNVLGLAPLGSDLKEIVENWSAVVVKCETKEAAEKLKQELVLAQSRLAAITVDLENAMGSPNSEDSMEIDDVSQTGMVVEASGKVGELLLFIAGRPPRKEFWDFSPGETSTPKVADIGAVMVDEEVPLIVMRNEAGRVGLQVTQSGLEVDVGMKRCVIEDLLLGSTCPEKKYLARSYNPDDPDDPLDPDAMNTDGDPEEEEYARLVYRQFTRTSDAYEGLDKELILQFSSLCGECHRPTIGALMTMGTDVSNKTTIEEVEVDMEEDVSVSGNRRSSESGSIMPGWDDENRTVFRLSLAMKKLQLAFNYEDTPSKHLAMAIVENFQFDMDIHPVTINLITSLGNAVVYDGTLADGHPNRQICGLRGGKKGSLIEVEFESHRIGESYMTDRVPNGNNFYSLKGKISAVHVVFFYRFINELLMYIYVMLEMAPEAGELDAAEPSPGALAVALKAAGVDSTADFTSTIVLLDIELDAPVISMPQNSDAQDCMMLDLGRVQVSNSVQWLGKPRESTLVDNMRIVCFDMRTVIVQNDTPGPNLIQDLGDGTEICIQRVLNDPTKKVPLYQIWISIPRIHAKITDDEYSFILSTTSDNLTEPTRIPDLAYSLTEKLHPEVVQLQSVDLDLLSRSQALLTKTSSQSVKRLDSKRSRMSVDAVSFVAKTKVQVKIGSAQLTLMNANKRGGDAIPLGKIQVSKLWLGYQKSEAFDMSVSLCIPTIEAIDLRPSTVGDQTVVLSSGHRLGDNGLSPSFVVLDYVSTLEKQSLQVRLQKPTLMLELGFTLAMLEFAVPGMTLGANMNKEFTTRDILLGPDPCILEEDMWLSPECRLLADQPGIKEFEFDGNGHRLILPDGIAPNEMLPMILVGVGKTLRFKRVTIIHAGSLGSLVQLKPGGQVLLGDDDDVVMIEGDDPMHPIARKISRSLRHGRSLQRSILPKDASAPPTNFQVKVSATGMNVQVFEQTEPAARSDRKGINSSGHHGLSAELDLEASCLIEDEDYTVDASLERVVVEAGTNVVPSKTSATSSKFEIRSRVLEPCNLTATYKSSNTTQEIKLQISQLIVNISPDLLDTVLHLRHLVLDPLTVPTFSQPLTHCTIFQTIWSSLEQGKNDASFVNRFNGNRRGNEDNGWITFWRPQPPAGYAILGDVVTCGQKQCNQQVTSVAMNSGFVAHPTGYTKVWELASVAIWWPNAPANYQALGGLVTVDGKPPSPAACVCIHSHVLVESCLGECSWLRQPGHLWGVNNVAGTFMVAPPHQHIPEGPYYDIRSPIGISPSALTSIPASKFSSIESPAAHSPVSTSASQKCFTTFVESRRSLLRQQSVSRRTMYTVEFKRIWVDKDARGGNGAGIWRPVAPPGYAILGDALEIDGVGPPKNALIVYDSSSGEGMQQKLLDPPLRFQLVWQEGTSTNAMSIWRPVPKQGYVAMGCVATVGPRQPEPGLVRCVRNDAVSQVKPSGKFDARLKKKKAVFAWITDHKSRNFVVGSSELNPPIGDMWKMTELDSSVQTSHKSKGKGPETRLELEVTSGPMSIQVRDLTRIPVLEVEVQNFNLISTQTGDLTRSYASLQVSLWSYNPMLKSWEPVVEATHIILHFDQNASGMEIQNVAPGSTLRLTSTGDAMQVTVAHACMNSLFEAYREWLSLQNDTGSQTPGHSLVGADATSIETTVHNTLGKHIYLLVDYGETQRVIDLDPQKHCQIQQPLAMPPPRHARLTDTLQPQKLLVVGICEASGLKIHEQEDSTAISEVYCALRFEDNAEGCRDIRTCLCPVTSSGHVQWHEQFVIQIPENQNQLQLILEIREASLSTSGQMVCTGRIDVTTCLTQFERWNARQTTEMNVGLVDRTGQENGNLNAILSVEMSRGSVVSRDSWQMSEEQACRGDRALRLPPSDEFAKIPTGGVQQSRRNGSNGSSGSAASSLVVPVSVCGVVVEMGYQGGMRHEIIRSLCCFVNSTESNLEVRLIECEDDDWMLASESSLGSSGRLGDLEVAIDQVFENQRYNPIRGWNNSNLLPTDRRRYSLFSDGSRNSDRFPNVELPPGWEWDGPWQVDKEGYMDAEGWSYSTDFSFMRFPPQKGAEKKGVLDFTRRRRWIRRRRERPVEARKVAKHEGKIMKVGIVAPGCSQSLPHGWHLGNWQLQIRPVHERKAWHHWSMLTSREFSGLPLQLLEEGYTQLAVCDSNGSHDSQKDIPQDWLCSSKFWSSFIVEGQELPGMDSMTDWTITAYPPLVLRNVLPMGGVFMVWERPSRGAPLQIRQQGQIAAGEEAKIHGADMRREVSLSFYPEGHEFCEQEPVAISLGYSEQAAGVSGRQHLPSNFLVSHSGDCMRVMLERELDVGVSEREEDLDPGAAVAMGYPLILRMFVPLWVVNDTEVEVQFGIVVMPSVDARNISEDVSVAEANQLQTVDTMPGLQHGPLLPAYITCTAAADGTEIMSYPLDDRQQYGMKICVRGSGWTSAIPLGSVRRPKKEGDGVGEASGSGQSVKETLEASSTVNQRILIRAQVPDVRKVYSIVAHVDFTGSGFIRSKVLHLEPHIVVSNHTGMDLQLHQPPEPRNFAVFSGFEMLPSPPTTTSAVQSTLDSYASAHFLKAGASCQHLDWWMGCMSRVLSVRPFIMRDSGVAHGSQWSAPFRIQFPQGGTSHVALPGVPVAGPDFLEAPMGCRGAQGDEPVATLKVTVNLSSPGCLHVVFNSIGGIPPYVVENRTMQPIQFRQSGSSSPWCLLPPLSAQGWLLPRHIDARDEVELQDAMQAEGIWSRTFSLHPEADLPLDMTVTNVGEVLSAQSLPLANGTTHSVVEIGDMDDSLEAYAGLGSFSNFSFYSALGSWNGGRVVRIHPEITVAQLRQSPLANVGLISDDVAAQAFSFSLDIGGLSISLVDQTPQELLLLSVDGLNLEMILGVGPRGGYSQIRVNVKSVQLDDQLPNSVHPVLASPWIIDTKNKGQEEPSILSFTVVKELGLRHGRMVYPTITAKLGNMELSVHESVIWRVLEMIKLLGFDDMETSGSSAQVETDVGLEIGLIHLDGLKLNISVNTDPTSRPRFSQPLSLGLEFANVEDVDVQMRGYEAHHLVTVKSLFWDQIMVHLREQIRGIVFSILEFYFSVGGVSQALSAFGKVMKSVVEQPGSESEGPGGKVDTFHEGLLEGGEAFGMGVVKGVTGVISRPIEGARKQGFSGFFKGVGRGILGVAVDPLGGALEAASKVAGGFDVLKDEIASKVTGRVASVRVRRRLPLCISGDRILRPYDKVFAAGQALMHISLFSGGWRAKRAAKYEHESYEGHEMLVNEQMVMWTSKRIMLLRGTGIEIWQEGVITGSLVARTNVPDLRMIWCISWDNLLAINLERSRNYEGPQDILVVHAKQTANGFPGLTQIAKTQKGTPQGLNLRQRLWQGLVSHQGVLTGGMGMTRRISRKELGGDMSPFLQCSDFRLVWKAHGGLARAVSIWRPRGPAGFASLGDVAVIEMPDPEEPVPIFRDDSSMTSGGQKPRLAAPIAFSLVYRDSNPKAGEMTIWEPVPPPGYRALGCLVVPKRSSPSVNDVRCLRDDFVVNTGFVDHAIWRGQSSELDGLTCSIWVKQSNPLATFQAVRGLHAPHPLKAVVPMAADLDLIERTQGSFI